MDAAVKDMSGSLADEVFEVTLKSKGVLKKLLIPNEEEDDECGESVSCCDEDDDEGCV